jgi:two-component system response regulator PilR (NtrC family)
MYRVTTVGELVTVQTKQVLLVEDNNILSKVLVRYLIGLGLQVTTADTVAGARILLSRRLFDVLVADMHLPDSCGLDLVRLLTDSRIPVVAMTAGDPMLYREQACHAGAAAFLEKPFPLTRLKRILNCLLTGHRCLPQCTQIPSMAVNLCTTKF